MNIKTFGRRLAGGLLAAGILATGIIGAAPANANKIDCTVDPCPDLTFTNFTSYKPKGHGLYVSYEVRNHGSKDSGGFKTLITLNGQPAHVVAHPGLAAGATHSFSNYFAIPIGPGGTPPTVEVRAIVDAGGEVEESDETNNKVQQTVII